MDYQAVHDQYMKDVHAYVHFIKHVDRRPFTRPAVWMPQYSEAHDRGYFTNPPPIHRLEHECGGDSLLKRMAQWLR